MSDALVLTGAVAKGAFTAGALAVLSDMAIKARLGIDITRVVGASSGALNAVYYANAIRSGTEAGAGIRLAEMWLEHATLHGALYVNLRDVVTERGLSDSSKLLGILRRYVPASPTVREVDLRLVVTNADGELAETQGGAAATTFQHVVAIAAKDFTTLESIERVYTAAAASAALPVLYAPVPVRLGGHEFQGLDGSLLNRSPLGLALDGAPEISRVFVVVPHARVQPPRADLRGSALVVHVFDMLVCERLFRDARAASRVNRVLERLERLLPDPAQRAAVLEAFEWTGRRRVEVVEIRPDAELPGDALAGFWSHDLRKAYVKAGVDTAARVLGLAAAPEHSAAR
jgi:predicted acylesterase/phospholipase RssA